MTAKTKITIEDREMSVSNLDKVLYPSVGFTKGQVIDYYARIADVMVPHLAGRPVTRKRYPDGVDADFFFEKNCPSYKPDWIQIIPMATEANGGITKFCGVSDSASLVWLANLAALEIHPQLQKLPDLNTPSFMVFDLDPGEPATVVECSKIAMRIRDLFANFSIECFAKTSGKKGMQVYVPLNTPVTFAETSALAKAVGQLLEKQSPNEVLTDMTRALRTGKVFIDWSQNNRIKTTIAVYSLRANERPTVSTPLAWHEVEECANKKDAQLLVFDSESVLERVEKYGDLFADVLTKEQQLPSLASSDE